MVVGIDPGTTESGYVVWSPTPIRDTGRTIIGTVLDNESLRATLYGFCRATVVIEDVRCYGKPVGYETFRTVLWSGRFYEAAEKSINRVVLLPRMDVRKHLCGTGTAKDPDVRNALLERFGPGKALAIGTKKTPGPLYGLVSHCWPALALAVTYADQQGERR